MLFPQELTPEAEVVSHRFTKAVIKSKAALSYQEAQARIDDPAQTDAITEGLRRLNRLAKKLRQGRAAAGALTLASPEVKFTLDSETLDPMDVGMYQARILGISQMNIPVTPATPSRVTP